MQTQAIGRERKTFKAKQRMWERLLALHFSSHVYTGTAVNILSKSEPNDKNFTAVQKPQTDGLREVGILPAARVRHREWNLLVRVIAGPLDQLDDGIYGLTKRRDLSILDLKIIDDSVDTAGLRRELLSTCFLLLGLNDAV